MHAGALHPARRANPTPRLAHTSTPPTAGLIKKLNRDGNLLAQWGTKGIDTSQFGNGIGGIATDANGDFFASDPYNNRIQKFKPDGCVLRALWSATALRRGVGAPGSGEAAGRRSRRTRLCGAEGQRASAACTTPGRVCRQSPRQWWRATTCIRHATPLTLLSTLPHAFRACSTFLLKFGSQGTAISNMEYVKGLTVASDGGVYVADAQHNAVKKYGGGAV